MIINNEINRTIHQKLRFLFVIFFCITVAACTSKTETAEEKEFSGFLSDYSQLEKVTVSSGEDSVPVLRWTSPALSERNYSKVMIDPVVIYPAPEPGPQLRSDVISNIRLYLNKAIRDEVSKDFEVVDEPGKDVIRMRAAITGVKTHAEDLAAYEYIPIALVFAGASTAAGTRDQILEIFAEAELSDSLSGERLGAAVRKGFGEPLEGEKDQVEMENVRPVLDGWAQSARRFLNEALK